MHKGKGWMLGITLSLLLLRMTGCQEETAPSAEEEIPGDVIQQPVVTEMAWGDYFSDLEGCAVFYNANEKEYMVYDRERCQVQRPPCSTFKILSSLIALEHGIIDPNNSVRPWSEEVFWNSAWNRDIGWEDAFRTSCVWYFRQITDEIGPEIIQEELDRLPYGNCDSSDWQGTLNTNNSNPALTGFWLESSLKISPMEQVETLERIFGEESVYSDETLLRLKQVMQTPENEQVCGKTGMGKAHGEVVDAWFVGFTYEENAPVYFCVYLGESPGKDVSSVKAKEIALRILSDIF